ncbi:MAG: hypothetical protein VB858_14040, partial [Planctomycetaceae bacterium]
MADFSPDSIEGRPPASAVPPAEASDAPPSRPEPTQDSLSAEDLPPVEPPSARFILQLFLVPGLIVSAVIGVWALFGKISSSEQDWRQQIVEMRSNNEHRRWRGANGMAQMLRADIERGTDGQQLSRNPAIAKELADLLADLLDEPASDKELISQQSFVTTTLGWLDAHEIVVPVLLSATAAQRDQIVQADAIRSLARIAGRAGETGTRFNQPEISDRLIQASQDQSPLIRQLCAYTLALVDGPGVEQRLRIMMEDRDKNTQVNAAIALARRNSTAGLPVFLRVLKNAGQPVDLDLMDGESEMQRQNQAEKQAAINAVTLVNVLKAI